MRCNPPCLAWVRKSLHVENLNRIVSVHKEFLIDSNGRHMWLVSSGDLMPGIDFRVGKDIGKKYEKLWCADDALTPINDPDIKTDETDIVAPINVEKFDYDVKEKQNV